MQNLFSSGDEILIVNNGNFGQRWVEMCLAFGLGVKELSYELEQKADNEEVTMALSEEQEIKAAVCVSSETSTGTVNDVEGFAEAAGSALTIVDASPDSEPVS